MVIPVKVISINKMEAINLDSEEVQHYHVIENNWILCLRINRKPMSIVEAWNQEVQKFIT